MDVTNPTSLMNSTEMALSNASPLTYAERIALAVLCVLVAVCGILGNTLVVLAVWLSRRLRTATNVYVVNLSVADMVTCLSVPAYVIALMSWEEWPGNELPCALVAALSMVCVGCSQFTLAGIALNRYVLVTKARDIYITFYSRRNLVISTAITWLIPILAVFLPLAFGVGDLGFDPKYSRCGPKHTESHTYDSIMALILFPIPFGTTVYCYLKIFIFVRRHCNNMVPAAGEQSSSSVAAKNVNNDVITSLGNRTSGNNALNEQCVKQARKRFNRRQHEITKNLFYVVCAFVICLTPYSALLLIPGTDRYVPYAGVLFLLNSALNPAIYAIKHPHFKSVFKAILLMDLAEIPEPVSFLRNANNAPNKPAISSGEI